MLGKPDTRHCMPLTLCCASRRRQQPSSVHRRSSAAQPRCPRWSDRHGYGWHPRPPPGLLTRYLHGRLAHASHSASCHRRRLFCDVPEWAPLLQADDDQDIRELDGHVAGASSASVFHAALAAARASALALVPDANNAVADGDSTEEASPSSSCLLLSNAGGAKVSCLAKCRSPGT